MERRIPKLVVLKVLPRMSSANITWERVGNANYGVLLYLDFKNQKLWVGVLIS